MTRHVHPGEFSDLLTGPISVNASVRTEGLSSRLVELTQDLQQWQDLNLRWGSINTLIDAVNETYAALNIDAEVPRGLD